jgi:glucosamine--fructose-6-phosphate aminotransferase (isomerizing)
MAKKAYADTFDLHEKLLTDKINASKTPAPQKQQLLASITKTFQEAKRMGVYFPLMRYGNHWFSVGKGASGEFYMFESATARNNFVDKRVAELQAAGDKRTKNVMIEDMDIDMGDDVKGLRNKTAESSQMLKDIFEMLEKGGYDHFMLKEIYEQPRSIKDCMRGRIYPDEGLVQLGGIKEYAEKLKNIDRIIIVACGTSWHAGLVGEYLIEEFARVPVEVEYASEFRYRNPIITEKDIVIAISQSGETADTMAAIELAKEKGATIFGICNVVGSSIPRLTHAGVYTHAGPEIGVASTKAFTAQVTVLTLIAFYIAQQKGTLSQSKLIGLLSELDQIPNLVEKCLEANEGILKIAEKFKDTTNCLFLGRGSGFPVALEGALKLKEISYIHAEGYPAAEMKHGPIALIDADMPVIFIATKNSSYEKVISNIQEVKARKGVVIAIVTEGDVEVKKMADYTIEIPDADEAFLPILATIPLQLLAYHIAVLRGCNVDQPRNLAKSVTVE